MRSAVKYIKCCFSILNVVSLSKHLVAQEQFKLKFWAQHITQVHKILNFLPHRNSEFIPPTRSHSLRSQKVYLPAAVSFAHKPGQRNPQYRRVEIGESSSAIKLKKAYKY